MKPVNKHTIQIYPQNEQSYGSRATTIVLSEEFFTPKQVAKISSICFLAATQSGAQISQSSDVIEVPSDVEESYKVKYEAAEKERATQATKATEATRKAQAYQIMDIAKGTHAEDESLSLHCCIEDALTKTISYEWERGNVRKVMVELGFIPKD